MKNFRRILSVALVLVMMMSVFAVGVSAAEFRDYYQYEEPFIAFGDVDFDERITVKDATALQKHLAKIITLSEDALYFADVDGNEKNTISDATLIQKYVAKMIDVFPVEVYVPDYSCLADGNTLDVELTRNSAVEIMVTVEEEGFYNITATTGGETTIFLDFTSEDMEGHWIAQADGETSYIFAKLQPGVYYAYMYIESGLDTTVKFKVSPTEEVPFDIEDAVELNVGDRIDVKAGEAPLVYKVDVESLNILDDELLVFTEGENPLVKLVCYDKDYVVNSEGYDDGTGNTMLSVYSDGVNTVYYIVVTQAEGGSDFTLCCDTYMSMLKGKAKDITLGTPDEIVVEEYTEEYEDEVLTYYGAETVYRFVPVKSGYYSFNFESNSATGVMALIADFNDIENAYIYIDMSETGGRLFDVLYLEEGVEYYVISIVELEKAESVTFKVMESDENEYKEAQQRLPFDDTTPDEANLTEIKLGETVEVSFDATNDEFLTKDFVFTAEEDCTVVLYSEDSADACIYILDETGMTLHMSDDIMTLINLGEDAVLYESNDFAVIGTLEKGETVYFSVGSYSETDDSFRFTIVNEADYTPIA